MATPLAQAKELDPITPEEAEQVYSAHRVKLIRAAYLKGFTPHDEEKCLKKFPFFKLWWETLNERQRERVKGVLAGESLHVFRD